MQLCMKHFPKVKTGQTDEVRFISHNEYISIQPSVSSEGLQLKSELYLWICGLCRALDSDEEYIDLSVRCGCRCRQMMGCHGCSSECQSGR